MPDDVNGGTGQNGQNDQGDQDYAAQMWGNIRKKVNADKKGESDRQSFDESLEPNDQGDQAVAEADVVAINPFAPTEDKSQFTTSVPVSQPEAQPEVAADDNVEVVETKVKEPFLKENDVPEELPAMPATESLEDEQMMPDDESVWDVLEQAGFTRGRILAFVIFLLLFVGLFIFVVFFSNLLMPAKDSDTAVGQKQEQVEEVAEPVERRGQTFVEGRNVEVPLAALYTAYQYGLEESPDLPIDVRPLGEVASDAGFEAAFLYGFDDALNQVRFVEYMQLLRAMQNIYDVDVYELLDRSADRSAALREHIEEMKDLNDEGMRVVAALDLQLASWQAQMEFLSDDVQLNEDQFFSSANDLLGEQAYGYFENFIDLSQELVKVQGLYNAYKNVRDMLVNSLNVLRPLQRDIEVNADALIKGVRVFDLPDSDIQAIIRLEQ